MITARRIYQPEGISIAHYDVTDRDQAELWQWWLWARGPDRYPDGVSLADKIPLHRAIRNRTAILTAEKRPGRIIITARL